VNIQCTTFVHQDLILAEESVFSVAGVKLWPEERRFPNSMLKSSFESRQRK
jgi:hypothetical protein